MTGLISMFRGKKTQTETQHTNQKPITKKDAKKPADQKIKTLNVISDGKEQVLEVKYLSPEQSNALEQEVRRNFALREELNQVDKNIEAAKNQQSLGKQMQVQGQQDQVRGKQMQALGDQKIVQGQQMQVQGQQMQVQGQQTQVRGQQEQVQGQQMQVQGQQMQVQGQQQASEATKKMIQFCDQYIRLFSENKSTLSSESLSEDCDSVIDELTRLRDLIVDGKSVKQEMQVLRPKIEKLANVIKVHQ